MMKKLLLTCMTVLLCLSCNLQAVEKKKVLVIMSNVDKLQLKDGKTYETGFFLNEFSVPVKALLDAGFDVVVATPQGKKPPMDKKSKDPMFFQNDKQEMNEAFKLTEKVLAKKNIKKLSNVSDGNLNEFAGVFIPGGHAPMVDLMVDPSVGKILTYFHKNAKPTAMICHGPIASIAVLENPAAFRKELTIDNKDAAEKLAEDWIYKGYEMTVFSTNEEKEAEKNQLKGKVEFYPEEALEIAGAKIKNKDVMQDNVIQDRELITGQNPVSDNDLAKTLIEAMNKAK
ncbi:MAG TPA: type 1 glutamine amidotransferase domain-containing protein [Candidatus Berkiella sp.]|nr:type 1 glutamine amidotransferase domain-containing protein [Candidatus Berkiella sp.]